jgi:rhodanese-related sulfurtransferase
MHAKTYQDFVAEAKTRIREVTARDALRLKAEDPGTVFVDCREHNEWALGHIPDALFIPRGVIEQNIARAVPKDRKVILYCASGNRSALAADVLLQMGYPDVASLAGGIRAWVDAGGAIAG